MKFQLTIKECTVLSLFFLCLLPLWSLSQIKNDNNFTITGNIIGLGDDSVFIVINNLANGRLTTDTLKVKAKNNYFKLSGKTVSTKNVWASLVDARGRKSFSFYLEPGNIKIAGQLDSLDVLKITGTKTNNENFKVRGFTKNIFNRIVVLRESLKNVPNETDAFQNIVTLVDNKFDSIQTHELNFIKTHPNSFLSATLLYVKQDKLPLNELEKLFNSFPLEIQQGWFGNDIKEKITARNFVAIGRPAPNFSSKDTSSNLINLSDFKGKYVLLEFWANWCVPCREQHPELVKLYEKYKDKGFTILQYSLDDSKAADKWKAAIIKDKLIWTQVSDLAGFASKVAKMYGVQPIPDNFFIDSDGKIIGRRMEMRELDAKLESLLR